jgi:hypothetical protein
MKHINQLVIAFAALCIIITSCDVATEQNVPTAPEVTFEQIGYLKTESKLRYFTFYINVEDSIARDSIPQYLKNAIREDGSAQMNTDGCVTASFYYLDKNQAPDITYLSPDQANTIAHERTPLASVWIMPNGQVNLIENPE